MGKIIEIDYFINIRIFFFSSFFQSVCVLGYCVGPLAIALIICRCILIVDEQTTMLFIIRFATVVVGFGWSTFGKYTTSENIC